MEACLVFIWLKNIQSATALTLLTRYTSEGRFMLQKSGCHIAGGACSVVTVIEEFCIKIFRSETASPPKKKYRIVSKR